MEDENRTNGNSYGIEVHSIDHIPNTERHGSVADQGQLWFTSNFHFLSLSIGFLGPSLGLSLGWTSLAGTLGIVFGTFFMAFHATQGPVLGLPQMVQSRAQFGFRGVIVPLLGTLANFVGYNVICALLLMSGLNHLFRWNHYFVLAILAALSTIVAVFGYDWLHKIFKVLFCVSLPLIIILSLAIVCGSVHHAAPAKFGWSLLGFGLEFAACASYNIACAPYVSDYSRYLPYDTRPLAIISSVFFGAAVSAIWLVVLGAWLATRLSASDPLVALNTAGDAIAPHFGTFLAIDSVLVIVGIAAMNNYSGMLALVTAADSFRPMRRHHLTRVLLTGLMVLTWVVIAVSVKKDAISDLSVMLTVVLYLLVPWSSVNLVDYFFIRRSHYNISELFNPNGIYGRWAWRGLLSYASGWAVIAPFAVIPRVWTGPIAARLGGVDVAWLVGLLSAGLSYFAICKVFPLTAEGGRVDANEVQLEGCVPADTNLH